MIFSSIFFLLGFLPLVLIVSYLLRPGARNSFLLIASLFFYWWGEGSYLWLLIITAAGNYFLGLLMTDAVNSPKKNSYMPEKNNLNTAILIIAIIFNIGILSYFKYYCWATDNINALFGMNLKCTVFLPLGISFFTFQALSYIIDIYRGEIIATRNIVKFSSFLTMFSQLVAGPIVRYSQIADQLQNRKVHIETIAEGTRRFIIGLGKKVILANSAAIIADQIFTIPIKEMTCSMAWMGLITYTIQIYYDFSGYSDMAIGIGLMLGFQFPENFNYPYIAKSAREFWKRWHITLSTWFRDYLYIPLGGNRKKPLRVNINLIVVFLLCGLWHGASWNFIIWGGWHGFFLSIERNVGFQKLYGKVPLFLKHFYALFVIMVGWIIFRSETMGYALGYFNICFLGGVRENLSVPLAMLIQPYHLLIFPLSVIGCMPWHKKLKNLWIQRKGFISLSVRILEIGFLTVLLMVCIAELFSSSYNPFIYFRF